MRERACSGGVSDGRLAAPQASKNAAAVAACVRACLDSVRCCDCTLRWICTQQIAVLETAATTRNEDPGHCAVSALCASASTASSAMVHGGRL